ncbi:ATP-binding protein [Hymenobacter montanus]|nr:ATP-binding protein [Hymenobacter montanus]
MNVFSNAFYAVQKKRSELGPGYQPTINVSTKREANQVRIQVRDHGIGVPAALKQKIFPTLLHH